MSYNSGDFVLPLRVEDNIVQYQFWKTLQKLNCMSYNETIQKWDEVGRKNELAAIHPAGLAGEADFWKSGEADAARVVERVKALGLDPTALSIVDYGCGVGRVSIPLAAAFAKVVGYDTGKELIWSHVGETPENYTPVFVTPKDQVDIAVSISVFIHHTYENGVKMLKEVASMVKEGGYLLLQIPVYDVAREPEFWSGVGVWTREQMKAAVKEAGLWIVEMWSSPGAFSYNQVGVNHHQFQVLQKVS